MHKWNNQKKLCGLQLTDTHARIIEINSGGQGIRAERRYTIELPAGCILNGVILKEAAVISSIEAMVNSLDLNGDQVNLIIPTANVTMRKSFSRQLEENTLRELIQLSFQGAANADIIKHSMLNYIRLETSIKLEDVLVIATPDKVIESYMRVAKAGGLEPINIEPSLFSLYRGIFQQWKHGYVEIPRRFISLQTDLGFSEIIIFDQGVPVFSFTVCGSEYPTVEAYIYQLQMEFKRILQYFKQAVFSDVRDLRQLYLVGEVDWLKKLLQPLEMLFDGNLIVLSFAELWCTNEMSYSSDPGEVEGLGA
jgi:Tfp pilus assembly PilM family ATPase